MKEVEQIVNDYLEAENTDYAIMIYGDWGCGKTYYVKNSLFTKVSQINSKLKDNKGKVFKYEPLYISLYGVTDISDILYKIHLELNPWLKNKPWIVLKTGISKMSSFFNVEFTKKESNELLSIFSIKKNKVLFFDDLERIGANLSLQTILGQINTFTEQENLKVIIVCNSQETGAFFEKLNEKTIRFSCQYKAKLSDVFSSMLNYYPNEYSTFLKTQKQTILDIFKIADYHNLRTLRFSLDIFEKIFNQQYESEFKDELLSRFLFFSVIYAVEYKMGHSKADLDSLGKVGPFSEIVLFNFNDPSHTEQSETTEKEQQYWEKFEKKYSGIINSFYYCQEIADYILNGYLDESIFKATIKEVYSIVKTNHGTEETKLVKAIRDWRNLADDELLPLIDKIISKIDSGEFSLMAYPVIYAELLQIEFFQVDDFQLTDKITNKFFNGIENVKSNHNYIELLEHKIPHWDNRETSSARDRYNLIYKKTIDANNFAKVKKEAENAISILDLIDQNKSEELETMLSDHKNRGSIFQYLSVKDVSDKLIKSNVKTLNAFNNGSYMRYPDHSFIDYEQERNFFIELQNLIDTYIAEKKIVKIHTVGLIDLNNNLKRICSLRQD